MSPRGSPPVHRHSILLIEDEPELSMLLEEILGAYDVRAAPTMQKAVELLQTFHPCTIISDLSLPDVPRSDVVQRIRQVAPKPPIILMSAIAPEELQQTGKEQGAARIIPKPFDLDEFENSLLFGCGL